MNGPYHLKSIALPSRISYKITMRIPVIVLVSLLSLSSCDIFNKDEEPVSFIRVSDFTLTTNGASEGSASENIGDVWLSLDGELLGAYEMPIDIPVIHEGPAQIRAFAGIKENGISTKPITTSSDSETDKSVSEEAIPEAIVKAEIKSTDRKRTTRSPRS